MYNNASKRKGAYVQILLSKVLTFAVVTKYASKASVIWIALAMLVSKPVSEEVVRRCVAPQTIALRFAEVITVIWNAQLRNASRFVQREVAI